jgi:hypothetical protein
MSETGILPEEGRLLPSRTNPYRPLVHTAFAIAMGWCIWDAIAVQLKWNSATEVRALVVDIQPPPPEPFGNTFRLRYEDASGASHTVTLDRMEFDIQPKLDQAITLRYLEGSPATPIGPRPLPDVGFNRGVRHCSFVMGLYFAFLLIVPLYRKTAVKLPS